MGTKKLQGRFQVLYFSWIQPFQVEATILNGVIY